MTPQGSFEAAPVRDGNMRLVPPPGPATVEQFQAVEVVPENEIDASTRHEHSAGDRFGHHPVREMKVDVFTGQRGHQVHFMGDLAVYLLPRVPAFAKACREIRTDVDDPATGLQYANRFVKGMPHALLLHSSQRPRVQGQVETPILKGQAGRIGHGEARDAVQPLPGMSAPDVFPGLVDPDDGFDPSPDPVRQPAVTATDVEDARTGKGHEPPEYPRFPPFRIYSYAFHASLPHQ